QSISNGLRRRRRKPSERVLNRRAPEPDSSWRNNTPVDTSIETEGTAHSPDRVPLRAYHDHRTNRDAQLPPPPPEESAPPIDEQAIGLQEAHEKTLRPPRSGGPFQQPHDTSCRPRAGQGHPRTGPPGCMAATQ